MKKLLCSLLSLSLLPALAMEDNQKALDRQLYDAIEQNKGADLKALIQAGANVNSQDYRDVTTTGDTPLMRAVVKDNHPYIALLLDEGADMRLPGKNWGRKDTALIRATVRGYNARKERISMLIVCSRFFPKPSRQELQDAQRRTRARISVLDQIRPRLPKDIKKIILACNEDVWQDACSTPLLMHTNQHNCITKMPLELLHTLIRNNALNVEKAIELLSNYKMEQLKPLMREAAPLAGGPQPDNNEIKPLINANLLEQNYGEAIRNHMRECLIPQSAGGAANCSIQ